MAYVVVKLKKLCFYGKNTYWILSFKGKKNQ